MIPGIANHLWQSTAFAACAALVALALRKNRASIRYWVWMSASLKFLAPFALLAGIGGRIPMPRRAAPAIAPARVARAIEDAGRPFLLTPSPAGATSLPWVLAIGWACGFTGVAGWRVREWRRARFSPRMEPGVFGIFRPVLILPAGIADRLTAAQLEAIVAHERCHIERHDNLLAAIHMAVEAIFWFHPLVWWIGARLLDERERACDEQVLRESHDPEEYAAGILAACRLYLESPLPCVAGVSGGGLRQRIERIMRRRVGGQLDFTRKLLLATGAIAAIAAPLAVGLLHAQAQTFEVVSIKPSADANGGMLRPLPGGALRGVNVTLRLLFQVAYDLQDNQISGGPAWMNSTAYDIDAKGGESGMDSVRVKLRTVLADRFQVTFHRDTRELPVYLLTVAKSGLKVQPSTRAPKEGDGGFRWGRGRAVSLLAPLSDFAQLLSGVVGRPVLDRTGAPGNFEFTLLWTPDNYKPPPEDAAPRPAGEPLPDPNGPTLFTALQEQLGLRLEAGKGPVDIYVIDRAEKPSEN